MLYLTGALARSRLPAQVARGIGLMLTPQAGYRPAVALEVDAWAADNGCFSQGDQFDISRYYAWLDRMSIAQQTCLFATAPDVVADARATLARSLPILPELRRRGWRAALVGQDGLEQLIVPWEAFDCFFIGGSTAWKIAPAAARLVREARKRSKWVHMGRVNSARRLLYAAAMGCDSADGTYMRFNPSEAIARMGRWLAIANGQLPLRWEV